MAPRETPNGPNDGRDPRLAPPLADAAGWGPLDIRAVDTVRVLAADAVQKAGHGHPGTAMSLAPLAYLLFQQVMRHDPADDQWLGRDRFVLSCGHSSLTLYIQLYLSGYGMELTDLEALRTWGSATPGHPEYQHSRGVEITTGPLGQGLASAVGMAMAARRERGLLDPDAPAGTSPFDHHVYVVASDGDLMEGVTSEASSLAGHQELGNLIVFYDSNHISIEDDTDISFSEDVTARYAAYGWQVQTVDFTRTGDYVEDVDALLAAVEAAKNERGRPSLILLRTIIGWPAPTKQNTGKAHGSALGDDEVAATKKLLGFDPDADFAVEDDVLEHARAVRERGAEARRAWEPRYQEWRSAHPERAALLDRLRERRFPEGWRGSLPVFDADPRGIATRKASGDVLTALAPVLPELWGGSADLAGSNNTTMEGEPSFVPESKQTGEFPGNPYGRTLHFGIREHAMGAILNGIALQSLTRPYGGTFLIFSDYMRPAVRLAALMKLPVTYVWTHDSIGLGEDGPTHQPVEQLAALRAIPGLDVVRPADANETAVCWRTVLEHHDRPAGLALTRQPLPVLERGGGDGAYASAEGAARGGYVLADSRGGTPDVILVGTGSEVHIALEARESLAADGIDARVVSMPCREWFADQPDAYRDEVLPPGVRARVSVEAAVAQGWRDVVGDAGRTVSLEHFGASAPYERLYEEFGITPRAVADAARESVRAASGPVRPGGERHGAAPTGGGPGDIG
ncbi:MULTISPECIES: transketolase [Streptomyces]|uniref:Transketolase n=1 Tax=Streptomyces griseus subsp. griseus (strain JCM 4626 / CBS 651.72 / NBRC 13350 / KCC S-0626 / ISP 5235) TaxID=455632 RepID=B1VX90_STRGG|nr:transketolase [Streptomyces griseus]MBW3707396.1 transketolase [Streptomyces griseus]BAG21736.1 putative transketolase [Streptomyces griseus subsp. griseus NBRC 13350]SEE62852.1 transketolase [Streptomyces griseus]SQA21619.1 Transketolase [Streptomyces griseus]